MVHWLPTALVAICLAGRCSAMDGPLSVSPPGPLELGPISDQQIVQKPFTVTNTSDTAVTIELAYCHFCPPPSISKERLGPGESATLVLEIHPRNRRGEVRASAGLLVGGTEVASANMSAMVQPRVWVEPWHLTIRARKGQPATGEARITLRHRSSDAQPDAPRARVLGAESDSPLIGVRVSEPELGEDLGTMCQQQTLALTLSPETPVGSTGAHVVIRTSDPLVSSVTLSIDAVVLSEATTEPDSVFLAAIVGEPVTAEFDVVAPGAGLLDVLEIGVDKRDECSGVILDARRVEPARTRVVVNAIAPGRPRQLASLMLSVSYRIGGGEVQTLSVPVSMMVRHKPQSP